MRNRPIHITHAILRLPKCLVSLFVIIILVLSHITASAKEERKNESKKEETSKNAENTKKNDPEKTSAESTAAEPKEPPTPEEIERIKTEEEYELGMRGYDETSVLVDMQWLGGKEISTLIHNNVAYLSVTDIFDFLKIKNVPAPAFDSITGFFIDQDATYSVDKVHNTIRYKSKVWHINPDDMIRTSTNLYLRSDYFTTIFGLECTFDSYNLSVKLNSNQEVPAIIEKKQEEVRDNLTKLKGTIKADTTIGRTYPAFHFGNADWLLYSEQQGSITNTRATLGLGGVVLGGETNLGLNYYSQAPFDEKQQYYLWRYANNDNALVRQVMLGKIATSSVSSIFAPIVGMQITNRPTTFRRSFGSYNISDVTGPNWIVELYVNNVLVDYTRADAAGFYSLDVPLVYGGSDVKLRFYGPYGELQAKEQHIEIPVAFLPARETEYTVSSGIVEDGKNSLFARSAINYGLNPGITVGGGLEYLSSVTSGSYMPFVTSSVKLLPTMYFSGEYTYGVRGKGLVNYRLPSNMQFEVDYIKYTKGQTAIIFNYDEEKKAIVSIPVHFTGFSGATRFMIDQITLPGDMTEWLGEWVISSGFNRASVNITTNWTSLKQVEGTNYSTNLYGNLSVSARLPYGFTATPQLQYDYIKNQVFSIKCGIEKMVWKKGFLNAAYERYPVTNTTGINVGFRFDFSATKVGANAYRFNSTTQVSEYASGSLIYDKNSDFLHADNRINVGRAGIAVLPYLDLNNNGHYDEGEPRVDGMKIKIGGGLVSYSSKDTIFHVTDLEPYTSYLLQINTDGVENISWQVKNKNIKVTPNVNSLTMVEVPFTVVGEVSGTVSVKRSGAKKEIGIGQILIDVYNNDSTLVTSVMSESDGYFSYSGLKAGSYYVCVDTAQLRKIDYTSLTGNVPVNIVQTTEGDLIDGLKFVLLRNGGDNDDEVQEPVKQTAPVSDKPAVTTKRTINQPSNFSILVDVTDDITRAGQLKTKLRHILKLPVKITVVRNDYLIEITGFETVSDAEAYLDTLAKIGYKEALVIRSEE